MKDNQEQRYLRLGRDDAEYVLTPVAEQLMAAGVSRRKTRTTLRATARRFLRIAAQDARLPMRFAEKHATSVAQALVL